jgi:sec-independent protein translocase protein TatC
MTATHPQRADDQGDEPGGGEMPLRDHLVELRRRLVWCLIAIVAGFGLGFAVHSPVFDVLIAPYCDLSPGLRAASDSLADECTLQIFDVLGAFFLRLKAAAVVAVVVAAPVVAYQVWRFVTPGLRSVERKYALPFLVVSQVLFALGAVFSYFVLPRALKVLLSFAGENVTSLMGANEYLGFLLHMMIGFGVAFEVPLILITLVLMGVLGVDGLRRWRRHAIFAAFVAAAIITPTTDPLTMTLMALPIVVFYEVSVLVARLVRRRRARVGVT